MISSLNDLMDYSERYAAKRPTRASRVKLSAPGYPEDVLAELCKKLPYLPESYLKVVRRFQVMGKSIGYFNLWSGSILNKNFVNCVVKANTDSDNPFLNFYDDNLVFEVGSHDPDIVCLGRKNSPICGQAYLLDFESSEDPILRRLAISYEQMLILAGNLHETHVSYRNDKDVGFNEFLSRLSKLEVDDDIANLWSDLLKELIY